MGVWNFDNSSDGEWDALCGDAVCVDEEGRVEREQVSGLQGRFDSVAFV